MWKLIKYDFMKGRNAGIITLAILLFFFIVICYNGSKEGDFISITLFMFSMMANMLCFCIMFSKIFESRLRKDNLLFYTGIQKRTIVMEPIVFILIFCLSNFIILSILFLFEHDTKAFASLLSSNTLLQTKDHIVYIFTVDIIAMNTLIVAFGGISLCYWSFLKDKKERRETTNEVLGGLNMIIILILSRVITTLFPTLENGILCLLVISIFCMLVYYVRSIRSL